MDSGHVLHAGENRYSGWITQVARNQMGLLEIIELLFFKYR